MNPSLDDRLASIVRSLTDIILPALPPDAGLAQEQTQLAIGHLKIIRAQMDATPAFEAGELADTRALGIALAAADGEGGPGGPATVAAVGVLRNVLDAPVGEELARQSRLRINRAIDELIIQAGKDGSEAYKAYAAEVLVRLQSERSTKDRRWFAMMGFDSEVAPAA